MATKKTVKIVKQDDSLEGKFGIMDMYNAFHGANKDASVNEETGEECAIARDARD